MPEHPLSLSGAVSLHGKPVAFPIEGSKATVFIFLAVECPIANRYAPEIGRIYAKYTAKGVRFYRVYIEEPSFKKAILKHTVEYGLKMPAALDPNKALVREFGMRVTPEIAVVGPDRILRYRGRIDDQNIEHGKIRPNYRRDLRIALDEFLAGKPISVPETPAIGCFIPK